MIIKKASEIEITYVAMVTADIDATALMTSIMDNPPDNLRVSNPSWREVGDRFKNLPTAALQDELENLLDFFDQPDASFGRSESMLELRLIQELTKRGATEYLDNIYKMHGGGQ